jgi:hypothetical protein
VEETLDHKTVVLLEQVTPAMADKVAVLYRPTLEPVARAARALLY